MAMSMMTGTVPSSGRSGTAAVMTQNEQTPTRKITLRLSRRRHWEIDGIVN